MPDACPGFSARSTSFCLRNTWRESGTTISHELDTGLLLGGPSRSGRYTRCLRPSLGKVNVSKPLPPRLKRTGRQCKHRHLSFAEGRVDRCAISVMPNSWLEACVNL